MSPSRDDLRLVLEQSRQLGFLGPGPVDPHIDHALGFAGTFVTSPTRALDLGAGGGVPGLALAVLIWPTTEWILLDASLKRTKFLVEAVSGLGLEDRVQVVRARAEEAGRDPVLRHGFDLVVARGFAAPAITAECAAPLLGAGGTLVVSEPPGGDPARWDAAGLATLGLEARPVDDHTSMATYKVLDATAPCAERYPRRVGIPAKRPLF